ncbi:MAG: hypothetical protein FD145_1078 [Candidatus Saganbacteria bacterium]|uniref:Uncharacterized protein n=1 Tax=Candidatus Saganbacteria bacterium TaxID=2575572 RepID=A0A833L0P4_UNCSA|nr:MAG: hypothetical protein FD145_1078 [Candidatus Saganbacteria bacterium]
MKDWTPKEIAEYFTFDQHLKTKDKSALYYGELITLLNPHIPRATVEDVPPHSDEPPKVNPIVVDMTLLANPYQIKKINPPE